MSRHSLAAQAERIYFLPFFLVFFPPFTVLPAPVVAVTADALGDLAELIREQTGADEGADV